MKSSSIPIILFFLFSISIPASGEPLKVVIAYGPGEKELRAFGAHLEENFEIECSYISAAKAKPKPAEKDDKRKKEEQEFTPTPFENIEALKEADVIVSNLYRTWAPPEQLADLKHAFLNKPVVGLRKAHHGFQNWLEADMKVFGVDYRGHYFGKDVSQNIVSGQEKNPLVTNAPLFLPGGGLYNHTDTKNDVVALIEGSPADKPRVLQTWTRINPETGQRVFYTRYDQKNLADEKVREMVIRAIQWAAGREIR